MRIPLAALGIAFDGHCLDCGAPLAGDQAYECATTFCTTCRRKSTAARLLPPIPLPDAATLRAWDQEYKRATMPDLSTLPPT